MKTCIVKFTNKGSPVDNGIPRVILQAHEKPDRVSDRNIV